jgi:hypothetical protein
MSRKIIRSLLTAALAVLFLSVPDQGVWASEKGGHSGGEPEYLYYIEATGSYYLPGTDGDVFYNLGKWYRHREDSWSMSDDPQGPWTGVMAESVPQALADLPPDFRETRPMGMIPYRYVVGPDRPDDDICIYYRGRYYRDYERHGYQRRWHPRGGFWYYVAPEFCGDGWDDRRRRKGRGKY